MNRPLLWNAARASQVIASAGCLIVAVRVATVGLAPLFEPSDGAAPARVLPVPESRAPALHAPPEASVASATPPDPGRSMRVTLSVTAGPPRSPVYVNGRHMGETPFMGDLSCKAGQPVKVEVVPARDPLIRFIRTCRGGMVELSEPDPPGLELR